MLFVTGGGNRYRGDTTGGGEVWPSATIAQSLGTKISDRKISDRPLKKKHTLDGVELIPFFFFLLNIVTVVTAGLLRGFRPANDLTLNEHPHL